MFAAMPLPMPGMARSALGSDSASAARFVVCCSIASAARRYDRTRNGSAASISRSAAVSSKRRARVMLSMGGFSPPSIVDGSGLWASGGLHHDDLVSLWPLCPLHDVKLDLIALT